jgi:hypothetical protein
MPDYACALFSFITYIFAQSFVIDLRVAEFFNVYVSKWNIAEQTNHKEPYSVCEKLAINQQSCTIEWGSNIACNI